MWAEDEAPDHSDATRLGGISTGMGGQHASRSWLCVDHGSERTAVLLLMSGVPRDANGVMSLRRGAGPA